MKTHPYSGKPIAEIGQRRLYADGYYPNGESRPKKLGTVIRITADKMSVRVQWKDGTSEVVPSDLGELTS